MTISPFGARANESAGISFTQFILPSGLRLIRKLSAATMIFSFRTTATPVMSL